MTRFLIMSLLFGFLASCATLSENECLTANWYEVGFQDGNDGRSQSHFGRHIKACSKHGVSPKQAPWREGREKGLRLFCVPERAYQIGRKGGSFPAVCTPQETVEMRPAHDWGRQYHMISVEIADIEQDISDRLDILDELADPNDPIIDLYMLEINRDQRMIRRLKNRQLRFSRWPR